MSNYAPLCHKQYYGQTFPAFFVFFAFIHSIYGKNKDYVYEFA